MVVFACVTPAARVPPSDFHIIFIHARFRYTRMHSCRCRSYRFDFASSSPARHIRYTCIPRTHARIGTIIIPRHSLARETSTTGFAAHNLRPAIGDPTRIIFDNARSYAITTRVHYKRNSPCAFFFAPPCHCACENPSGPENDAFYRVCTYYIMHVRLFHRNASLAEWCCTDAPAGCGGRVEQRVVYRSI